MGKYFQNNKLNLLVLILFNLVLRLFRLDAPNEAYFDEGVFYIPAAQSYLTGFTDPNFEHPPLGKIILALGIFWLGDNPWGWRIMPVLFGTGGVVATYFLAYKLFNSSKVALLSAFFLTFDFLWFVFSRGALLEIFVAVFSLISIYFLWVFWQEGGRRNVLLLGVFIGLAAAVKWSGWLLLLPVTLLLFSKFKRQWVKGFTSLAVIGLVSLSVYLSSYIPYLGQNHNLVQVWERQQKIWHYHTVEVVPLSKETLKPYLWFTNPIQPLYQSAEDNRYILALANPLLFWGALAIVGYYTWSWKRSLFGQMHYLVLIFWSLYLPWLLVPRYVFFYYLLVLVPILAILLAKKIVDLENGKSWWEKKGLVLRSGFVTGIAVGFLLFYPLLAALPVTHQFVSILFGLSF